MSNLIPQAMRSKVSAGIHKNVKNTGGVVLDILKIDQETGVWSYGKEHEPLDEGTQLLINPASLQHGWVCWVSKKPFDTKMVPMWDEMSEEEDLPDYTEKFERKRDGWQETCGFVAVIASGPAKGSKIQYTPGNHGGRQAIRKIAQQFSMQLDKESEEALPLVTLSSGSYYNKEWDKDIIYPVLAVESWKVEADFMKLEGSTAPKLAQDPDTKVEEPEERDDVPAF